MEVPCGRAKCTIYVQLVYSCCHDYDAASMAGIDALENAARSDRNAGTVNSLIARTHQD